MNEALNQPPYNEQAEQAVLGAILQNNEYFDDIDELITSDDFYNHGHREIYQAICITIKQGGAADAVTISGKGEFDLAYCVNLVKNCPASRNSVQYAKAVKDKSIQRSLIGVCNEISDIAFGKVDDVIKLVGDAEKSLSKVSDKITVSQSDNTAKTILKRTVEFLEHMADNGKEIIGSETSLPDLDKKINGLKKGTFVIIAARPSMGKTTLAMQMALHEGNRGGRPLVFSLETPAEQLMLKAISNTGGVDIGKLQRSDLSDNQWAQVGQATRTISNSALEIIDESTITTEQIRVECRRYAKRNGSPTFIMIDYIQLISGRNTENRTQEISQISRDLKALSREFKCPVVGLSQLNRELEKRANKRPINADLRESGQLEQDADEIILIYRDEVYDEKSPDKGKAELIVGKSKMNQIGTVVVEFDGQYQRFNTSEDQRMLSKEKKAIPYTEKFGG